MLRVTAGDVVVDPELSVATAVSEYVPSAGFVQFIWNGAAVSVPIV